MKSSKHHLIKFYQKLIIKKKKKSFFYKIDHGSIYKALMSSKRHEGRANKMMAITRTTKQ